MRGEMRAGGVVWSWVSKRREKSESCCIKSFLNADASASIILNGPIGFYSMIDYDDESEKALPQLIGSQQLAMVKSRAVVLT
jgi:hypothetical protein